uniref:CHK kinase-like domain-containing protein n=1 Tax=Musca domestica TaxID=7370 RepID=A0A1I8NJG8_MUSDO
MSLYNEDELTAPEWIDRDFIQMVLAKYEKVADVELISYDMSPACMKGDHYASIMFRCKVEYRLGDSIVKRSLIMKTLPVEEDSKKREFLMNSKLFETEIKMYCETLPKFEKILAECGEPTKLSAGLFYHALQPHKILIMEDLCELGYSTVRARYLTEHELKVVYTKLAKLHAVSYMLGQSDEEHESVAQYQDGFLATSLPVVKDMMISGMKSFLKMLSSRQQFAIYVDKVQVISEEMQQSCKDLFNAYKLNGNKGDVFVLNHGDFHMRNMMFKINSEESAKDMLMVDYQISCYAPSCIDLIYSQFMIMSPTMRLQRRHAMMRYYFTEFLRILKKLNFEGDLPKYSLFQQSTLKYRHFAIYCLGVFLPLVLGFLTKTAEELKDVNAAEVSENPDSNSHLYYTPEFIAEVENFMPLLLDEGYLD